MTLFCSALLAFPIVALCATILDFSNAGTAVRADESSLNAALGLQIAEKARARAESFGNFTARQTMVVIRRPSRRGHCCAPPLTDPSMQNCRTRFLT